MHGAGDAPPISLLGGVHPLEDARGVEDDWTGITSTAERKRRQNRLNQRAHRRRKLAQQKLGNSQTRDASISQLPTLDTFPPTADEHTQLKRRSSSPLDINGWILYSSPEHCARVHGIIRRAYESYMLGGPRPTNLHVLICINVVNAMYRNATAMGFPVEGLCADEHVSPWSERGPRPVRAPALPPPSCPASLRPTEAQRRVEHHPWVDLFPFPRFRDNVLLAVEAGLMDEDELCLDITEADAARDEAGWGRPALIVWGEAWDTGGWEVNVAFVRRWGWLLRGCPELVESTNYWREVRGEKRIVFDTGLASC